ncbi:aldose 1-epimerase [Labrys neptuniae]
MDELTLTSDVLELRVSRQGGALLEGLTRDGRPFLRPPPAGVKTAEPAQATCFPMVPICNRVEGNRFHLAGRTHIFRPNTAEPFYLHGDGWLRKWSVDHAGPHEIALSFVQAEAAASPHIYRARQRIELKGNSVSLVLSVENLADEAMPFGIGFHPFFPRTETMRLQAAATQWWREGPGHLPLEREAIPDDADFSQPRSLPKRWLNNAYEDWNGLADIAWPEMSLSVRIGANDLFRRFMVYAPDADRSFFCFEPVSHTPNALALPDWPGLRILETGETLTGSLTMTIEDWEGQDG